MSEPTPIAVGVIGVGHLGRHHARLAKTLPGWRCVGAWDTDPARLDAICTEHDITPLRTLDEVVERADAVVIATPTVTHREVAARFLAAGKHVLVEKPIAASVAEAEEMIEMAQRAKVALGVGHVEFYNPAVQAVLAVAVRPRFIEAQRLSPFTRRSLDIDVILDLMVHDLQVAQALAGGAAVTEVRAAGIPVLSAKIDLANVRLEFAGGCVATITASRVSPDRVRKLRVFEEAAYFSVDYAEQRVTAAHLVRGEGEPHIEPVDVIVGKAEPLAAEHLAFQRACRGEAGAFVSGRDGAAALAAAVAVSEACRTS